MIESLHVKNLALIDEEEISFDRGFNILTGETGAGKSIVLGSVNLALGAKAGADLIRSGCDSALVELVFALNEDETERLKALDVEPEDGTLVLTRRISQGKSVCRVNGETVPASVLKNIAGVLLDIYGQHDNQTLLNPASYEKMLDEYAGGSVKELQDELRRTKKEYNEILAELNSEKNDSNVNNREKELLEYEIEQIQNAALKPGEDVELEKRYTFLSNARKIMETLSEVHLITGYDSPESTGNTLGSATSKIKGITRFDDTIAGLADELAQIEDMLGDFNRSLSSYMNEVTFDEEEFAVVESRLDLINDLKSKFGNTIEDVQSECEKKQKRLDKLNNYDAYMAGLNERAGVLKGRMLDICAQISILRIKKAKKLEDELTKAMEGLNFQNIALRITVKPDEEKIKDTGYDSIEFLLSLNVGEQPRPMQNIASGGELSRIMLAIKSVFAKSDDVTTLIFDEIDAGISGKTAYMVAQKMKELSKDHQLICITHLPQIAAMADTHYLIQKTVDSGRTQTGITKLNHESSVNELARMLGNDSITEAALQNAREMKKGNNN